MAESLACSGEADGSGDRNAKKKLHGRELITDQSSLLCSFLHSLAETP